uniref:Uncharacterized protein n=1 Tax=Arundo donax TaxID=35708 RepID=A0A0A8YN47_ARUDO
MYAALGCRGCMKPNCILSFLIILVTRSVYT